MFRKSTTFQEIQISALFENKVLLCPNNNHEECDYKS